MLRVLGIKSRELPWKDHDPSRPNIAPRWRAGQNRPKPPILVPRFRPMARAPLYALDGHSPLAVQPLGVPLVGLFLAVL